MERVRAAELQHDQAGAELGGDNSTRSELIAAIEEIAPGPDNREVRRAIQDAARDLIKTAKLAGSSSPFDHVRMAFSEAAANPKRRKSIESLARGIVRNWATEGFPAIVAPEPPGRPKPRPDPEADRRAAVEKRRADARTEAEAEARKARWEALDEPAKDRIRAEFEAENPGLTDGVPMKFREFQKLHWCLERMDRTDPSPSAGGAP